MKSATCFLYHNFILFSEKNCKNQAQLFYQYHSLALYTVWDIFQFNFKKSLDLDLTGLGLTLWYIGLGQKKILNCLTGLALVLWYIAVRLEKCLGFGMILWYIGLGHEKHLE